MNTLTYNELLEQIHRLPNEEFKKLVATLSSKPDLVKEKSQENIQQLLLQAPTWNDQQWEAYQQARAFINQSRLG